MAIYRQEVVDIMLSWKKMKESDGTYKPIVDIYNTIRPLPCGYQLKYTDDWGPSTVSAAYQQAGLANIFPCECNCVRMVAKAKEMNIWEEFDQYWPKLADVCILNHDAVDLGANIGIPDQAGLVISTDKKSRSFVIMIGNSDHAVETRTLSVGSKIIRGFITPSFDNSSSVNSLPKQKIIITEPSDDYPKSMIETVSTGTLSKVAAGTTVNLIDALIYASPKTKSASGTKTGKYYIWSVDTINGRIRITNSKDYVGVKGQVTGWIDVSTALSMAIEMPSGSAGASTPQYQVNAVYVVQFDDLQVRSGPGTNYPAVTYADLTPNARKYDKYKTGCLCSGAKVTCLDIRITGINVWMQIPSGWIPAYYNKRFNVK